jgi:hypothetical protein
MVSIRVWEMDRNDSAFPSHRVNHEKEAVLGPEQPRCWLT